MTQKERKKERKKEREKERWVSETIGQVHIPGKQCLINGKTTTIHD